MTAADKLRQEGFEIGFKLGFEVGFKIGLIMGQIAVAQQESTQQQFDIEILKKKPEQELVSILNRLKQA